MHVRFPLRVRAPRRIVAGTGLGPILLLLGLGVRPAWAETPAPLGEEFQVNTQTSGYQAGAAVASDADGDFVVVWGSYGPGLEPYTIQGQRYASNGAPLGGQFQVNSHETNSYEPAVAAQGGGDFVVVWQSYGSPGNDPDLGSIQARRFASDGAPLGDQLQVNTYTTGSQEDARVAVRGDGAFTVVWESEGSPGDDTSGSSIQGRRFASDGAPEGGQFQVNDWTTAAQTDPSVALAGSGAFVAAWESDGSPGDDANGESVQARRYDSSGVALGGQFQVNTYTTADQSAPAVDAEADGGFVATWESVGSSGTDSSFDSVQARRYASDGAPLGSEFQVNTYTTGYQHGAAVAVEPDGDFVVAWFGFGSFGSDTGYGSSIQGQRYASDGASLGSQFQVNTYTSFFQDSPAVASADGGDFVVVWHSGGSFGSDPADSVQGQRFMAPEPSAGLLIGLALATTGVLGRRRRPPPRPVGGPSPPPPRPGSVSSHALGRPSCRPADRWLSAPVP